MISELFLVLLNYAICLDEEYNALSNRRLRIFFSSFVPEFSCLIHLDFLFSYVVLRIRGAVIQRNEAPAASAR